MKSILLIYTGGTIGMKTSPSTGALVPFMFNQIEEEVPELKKFGVKISNYTFDPIIDSSNVSPAMWSKLAEIIKARYNEYDGFVVLHGTDTMSYTASALSFMLQNLDKPVIFTGSQIPIGVLRTDGKENLITAIEIAAAEINGEVAVPEVCIYFDNNLMRANRTTKYSAHHFNAFRSYNYPNLAVAGIDISYNRDSIRKVDTFAPSLDVHTELCPEVAVIRLFPGITQSSVLPVLSSSEIRGVVIQSYGSGNAPQLPWLITAIKEAIDRGVIIVNVTQCTAGSVNMDLYDTGRELKSVGVIGGRDITTEAIVAKLMYILGKNLSHKQIKLYLEKSIRGEMTI